MDSFDAMRGAQVMKEAQTAPSKAVQTFLTEKVDEEVHSGIPSDGVMHLSPRSARVMNGTAQQSLKSTLGLEEVRKTLHATRAAGWEEAEQAKCISR